MNSRILFSDAVLLSTKEPQARRAIRKRIGSLSVVVHVRREGDMLICSVGVAEKNKKQPTSESRLL